MKPGSAARSLAGMAGGLAVAACLVFFAFHFQLNLAASGLLELLVVLVVALKVGFWEATAVSFFSIFCLCYFVVPPVFSFAIQDPQNWVALGVFEVTALLVSRLSSRARWEAANAVQRREDLERLYEVSRRLLEVQRKEPAAGQIERLIAEVFPGNEVSLFDETNRTESGNGELAQRTLDVFAGKRAPRTAGECVWIEILHLSGQPIAVLGLRGPGFSDLTAKALASLSEVALERARSFERESRAEAERRTEELRTALLDALAHEFKTPLTAIRTASNGLLAMNELEGVHRELVALVDGEAARLNELTSRLIQTSRMDNEEIHLRLGPTTVQEVTQAVLRHLKRQLAGHPVQFEGMDEPIEMTADRELLTSAIAQVVDNAAKYSDPGTAIAIKAERASGTVRIAVANWGPGIPAQYQTRVFERFFRAPGFEQRAIGTGLGLSVTKRIIEAHHGTVSVSSEPGGKTEFVLAIPVVSQDPKRGGELGGRIAQLVRP